MLLRLIHIRPHHFKFPDNFHGLPYIEGKRLKRLIDEYLALLHHLILRDTVQICERLMQESSNVLNLLQNLRIVALVNILNQLFKNLFYVFDLLLVG